MKKPTYKKQFSSSILLWIRKDKDRQDRMDYWKGPHSKIISANPGQVEYRQIHLAEKNVGLWPSTRGIETKIPANRKVDGVAEVTFKNMLAPIFQGKEQTKLAFKDEINVFERTLHYIGLPGWSRWYTLAPATSKSKARSIIFIRRKNGVSSSQFRRIINNKLAIAVAETDGVQELRTQVFTPWQRSLWNSPDVKHDNPKDAQFHTSLIVAFGSEQEKTAFFSSEALRELSVELAGYVSAIHAYDATEALTFVKDGKQLPKAKEL